MRMSRRAVIKAFSAKWHKHLYKLQPQRKVSNYKTTDWKLVYSKEVGFSVEGRTSYLVTVRDDYGWETIVVELTGERERIDAGNPGTVYHISNGPYPNRIYKYVVNTDGSGELYERDIEATYTESDAQWKLISYVGVVRAKKGTLPDTGRGYTYEKTDGEYTIMTDGENYYAYELWG